MFCSRAIRNLIGRSSVSPASKLWTMSNSKHFHNSVKFRSLTHEARAVQKILLRSNVETWSLVRACGVQVRGIHTSNARRQNNEDNKKNNDDDEKDRMLSALKTAVGFFVVPLFLLYLFSGTGSPRREASANPIPRDRAAGTFYCTILLNVIMVDVLYFSSTQPAHHRDPME